MLTNQTALPLRTLGLPIISVELRSYAYFYNSDAIHLVHPILLRRIVKSSECFADWPM